MRFTRLQVVLLAAFLAVAGAAIASQKVHVRGHVRKDGTVVQPHERSRPKTKKPATTASSRSRKPKAGTSANREGRFKRSEAARREFMKRSGYPHGRPGYVVDHVVPLACGGPDVPSNMQWQTVQAAKAKDAVERKGCNERGK